MIKKRIFNDHYEDIIDLPHHVSASRRQMTMIERAAQFSPFAALTGHDAAVKEKARLTDEKVELDENQKAILNEKLQMIQENIEHQPEVTFTFFRPDDKKNGGEYIDITGKVKKIMEIEHCVRLADGTEIPIDDLYEIIIS